MNDMGRESVASKVNRSQRYFNKASLFVYDALLYGVISKYAWGCSLSKLDAHYRKYISTNHLEVGVGTGFLLNRVNFSVMSPRVALMDLNPACLAKTQHKLARYAPEIYVQNLLEPVLHTPASFDSIGINYVMHCVPGSFMEKGAVFSHLKPLLKPGGILFGTTVLSQGVRKNLFARFFMWLMNVIGVFNNRRDNAHELEHALQQNFHLIDFEVNGTTAFFAVRHAAKIA